MRPSRVGGPARWGGSSPAQPHPHPQPWGGASPAPTCAPQGVPECREGLDGWRRGMHAWGRQRGAPPTPRTLHGWRQSGQLQRRRGPSPPHPPTHPVGPAAGMLVEGSLLAAPLRPGPLLGGGGVMKKLGDPSLDSPTPRGAKAIPCLARLLLLFAGLGGMMMMMVREGGRSPGLAWLAGAGGLGCCGGGRDGRPGSGRDGGGAGPRLFLSFILLLLFFFFLQRSVLLEISLENLLFAACCCGEFVFFRKKHKVLQRWSELPKSPQGSPQGR